MKRSIFNDGFLAEADDLNNMENTLSQSIEERVQNFFGQGIVSGLVVTAATYPDVDISAGVAYNDIGERILLPIPLMGQAVGVGLNYVKLAFLETVGTPVAHPVTGVNEDTRVVEGYTLTIDTTPPVSGEVLIKRVNNTGSAPLVLDDVGVVLASFGEVVEARDSSVYGAFSSLDLRLEAYEADGKGTITDTVTPAATATSLLNRLNMFANRFKTIIGTGVSWLDSVADKSFQILANKFESNGHLHTGATGDSKLLGVSSLQTGIDANSLNFNVTKVAGYLPGNSSGNVPVSNGTLCVGLNAQQIQGVEQSILLKKGIVFEADRSITATTTALIQLNLTNLSGKISYQVTVYTNLVGDSIATGETSGSAWLYCGIKASTISGYDYLYIRNTTAHGVIIHYKVTTLLS